MRSEQEMLDLILGTAREDERIRAVLLNGSRANPAAPQDPFRDFDVVYIVADVAPFRGNREWIRRFGEIMILQVPEDMGDPPARRDDGYSYLMQFSDGNRIDLSMYPPSAIGHLTEDILSISLLDKDGLLNGLPPPSEAAYLPRPPSAKAFDDCCNEFWWVSPYVAKGLWRGELTYAKAMQDQYVRAQLMKMLDWYVGMKTGFAVDPGKFGKRLRQYLEPELWVLLMETYSDSSYDHTWDSLVAMCQLFRHVALAIARHFGFGYPEGDDARVTAHLRHVRSLPKDAREIY
jgi:aminoglycoside 6-adenylyltransferase